MNNETSSHEELMNIEPLLDKVDDLTIKLKLRLRWEYVTKLLKLKDERIEELGNISIFKKDLL